jgi:hypothetical protein
MEYSGALTASLIPSLAKEKTRGLVSDKMLFHNELGGLVNTYTTNSNTCVPVGQTLTLMPQLPDGEEDSGQWLWNTGQNTRNITVTTDSSSIYRVTYTNVRGIKSQLCFSIAVKGDGILDRLVPFFIIDGTTHYDLTVIVGEGKSLTLGLKTPSTVKDSQVTWSNGATGKTLVLDNLYTSCDMTATYKQGDSEQTFTFNIHVKATTTPVLPTGNYMIEDIGSGRLLTGHGLSNLVTFEEAGSQPLAANQTWSVTNNGKAYAIVSLPDSLGLVVMTRLLKTRPYSFYLEAEAGTDHYALHSGTTESTYKYWLVNDDGTVNTTNKQLTSFPFRFIPFDTETLVETVRKEYVDGSGYHLSGHRMTGSQMNVIRYSKKKGVYIVNGKKVIY